jgi:predicted permease
MSSSFEAEGYVPAPQEQPTATNMIVGADYFHVMNTPIVAGREFTPADTSDSQKIAIVNQTFARRYFAKAEPVGKRIRLFNDQRVVVGVARNSKQDSIDKEPGPVIYLPSEQYFGSEANFLIRTMGAPMAYARAAEDAIHSVDPALPVYAVRPLDTAISASYVGQQIGSSFLGLFGGVALALATIGLYGVLAYTVAQRSREVGIRVALGASRLNVLSMILGQGMRLAGIGLVTGLALAAIVTRFMRTLLLNVSPTDLPTIAAVSGVLALVALTASFIPAHRATRIDPILAIRHE